MQLPSPRRSWRSAHKAAEGSPLRLPEGLPNQTGYDSDDEGEPGSHEDADELEDAPEPLPAPRSHPQALFRSTQVSFSGVFSITVFPLPVASESISSCLPASRRLHPSAAADAAAEVTNLVSL